MCAQCSLAPIVGSEWSADKASEMSGLIDTGDTLAQRHRRALMRVLLVCTALFGCIFIALNFAAGKYLLMSVEIAVTGFALWLLPVMKRTPNLQRWTLSYLIVLYSGTTYALVTPATSVSVFGWVLIMPVVAHLLLGRFWGGVLCGVFVPLSAAIFVWRFGSDPLLTNPGSVANIVTVTACSYLLSHVYEASRAEAETQLSTMALTDSLTGLANRSQLEQSYARLMIAKRLPLSLLMLDLDYFKRINDAHGHDTGDAVLRAIAKTMVKQLRRSDLACRLGGEEFCVLLPETPHAEARQLAERMRDAVEVLECQHRHTVLRLTASIGIAVADTADEPLEALLHRADENLYRAKLDGRNRVVG